MFFVRTFFGEATTATFFLKGGEGVADAERGYVNARELARLRKVYVRCQHATPRLNIFYRNQCVQCALSLRSKCLLSTVHASFSSASDRGTGEVPSKH